MFKNLLQFWNGKDFLNQVLEDFKNMLDDAERMFISMSKKLVYNEEQNDLENKIYSIDKRVNELERDIRKRIIQHLTIQPSVDVSTCLLLMSVVKDAERIGDYSKNLFGVSKIMQRPMNITTYKELFDDMDKDILVLFQETKDAFMQSDEKKATLAWKYEKKITSSCDKIVGMLAVGNLS
ncbi:MAG: PhoU domain-containing protein, partial [Candidatus Omnitrophica bacterium]|nr:PhoU domain-containing protein [Candidatus Omnitrophota bacterium]